MRQFGVRLALFAAGAVAGSLGLLTVWLHWLASDPPPQRTFRSV